MLSFNINFLVYSQVISNAAFLTLFVRYIPNFGYDWKCYKIRKFNLKEKRGLFTPNDKTAAPA